MRKASVLITALLLGIATSLSDTSLAAAAAPTSVPPDTARQIRADFGGEPASSHARQTADWAVQTGNHKGRPFIVLDKVNAKLFAFDKSGRLIRSTPVLLGMGIGDTFPPGVIDMDMSATLPSQRITPAGRFEAEEGDNLAGQKVLWVDYDAAIAIHRLPARETAQRRRERLASPTPADNRITYGCINVPPWFYDVVIKRYFSAAGGIVYVLPERRSARSVFGSYEVAGR